MHLRDPAILSNVEIEEIEKQSLRYLYTAAYDFGLDAFDIFHQSSDEPKDIAEDITREMLDRLGCSQRKTARILHYCPVVLAWTWIKYL